MKLSNTLGKTLAAALVGLLASSANATLLTVGDGFYLGSILPPTDAANETDYDRIVALLTVGIGASATLDDPGSTGDFAFFDRTLSSINPVLPIIDPFADAECAQGGGGNENDALGCDFLIQKYFGTDGIAHVWDISSIVDSIETPFNVPNPVPPPPNWQSNQWTAFNAITDEGCTNDCVPCTDDCISVSVPEPGTLALLALGLLGILTQRRPSA